jgi:predicted nuclease with TOPRIM domain
MNFLPLNRAANAMDRLTLGYPQIIRHILDHLARTERCFERLSEGPNAKERLYEAMWELQKRIKNAVETIAKAESSQAVADDKAISPEQAEYDRLTDLDNSLTSPEREILLALLVSKAFDLQSGMTMAEIVDKIEEQGGVSVRYDTFKKAGANLKKRGLNGTSIGRKGKRWLTREGQTLARHINDWGERPL